MQSTKLLQRIYDYTFSRRIDLTDELNSFDFKKCGSISNVSFPRCFASMGLQLSPAQFQTLIDDFSQEGTINISDFVRAVQESQELKMTTSEIPHSCETELRVLDAELTRRRQTLYDALRRYDRVNNGNVPTQCFYTEFGFGPTIKTIVNEYEVDGQINYHQIQKDMSFSQKDQVQIPDTFNQLARFVKSKNIDARLLLSRFDTERTGQLNPRSFISLISSFGVNIGPSDIEKMIVAFRLPNGFYDAERFVDLIDQYEVSRPVTTLNITRERLSTVDPMEALNHAKDYIKSHRINVREMFSKFDDEGANGVITESRFVRLFHQYRFDVNNVELVQIASLFPGNGPETVNYHYFIDAVEEKPAVPTTTFTVDDILDRIRTYLHEQKRHFGLIASRFDREQSGDITPSQLVSAFQFLQFRLSPNEVPMLRNAFPGHKPGTVEWKALASEVDPIEQNYQQHLITQKTQYLESQTELPSTRQVPPNVYAANKKVMMACAKANIKPNPLLVRLDRSFEGTITQAQFVNFLQSPPISLPAAELRIIINFYRLNGSSEIDYVKFCRDLSLVDLTPEQKPQDSPPELFQRQQYEEQTKPQHDIPMIVRLFLKRYKMFVQNAGLPLSGPFTSLDGGKTGLIPASRVGECLNYIGFDTARDELETVLNTFRDTRKFEAFNYSLFVKAAEAEVAEYSGGNVPPEVQKEVLDTEMIIKDRLSSRNRSIRMAFAGIARSTISIEMFFERLATIDLVLKSSQANALVRKYRIDQSDQIDWRKFCNDVENCKTLGF
ncbi:EF hand family protein [Tritrichomonas foetus]|uniref:EF hand family protein n=1 Tax=Tritrichomonas foetus TaxID=1144522 RepID=A0A1J4JEK2_9EUKA|nr:EF hand family protein [Tritrichomonas foetus]|eukprot:OHS97622.1 EF hand family protein [Tritrichomonas foetus]